MSCSTLDMLDGVKTPTRHELKEERGEMTQKLFQVTVPSDHVTVISNMCFQYSSSQLSPSAHTESTWTLLASGWMHHSLDCMHLFWQDQISQNYKPTSVSEFLDLWKKAKPTFVFCTTASFRGWLTESKSFVKSHGLSSGWTNSKSVFSTPPGNLVFNDLKLLTFSYCSLAASLSVMLGVVGCETEALFTHLICGLYIIWIMTSNQWVFTAGIKMHFCFLSCVCIVMCFHSSRQCSWMQVIF